jgi:hypothetical protein
VAVVAISAAFRIGLALNDPNFDRVSPAGLLRTDPGLLYYVTESIVDADGRAPWDFRADPRIEYPLSSDIPAMFTVGQEFLVAWTHLAFGESWPLHVWAIAVMAIWASLSAIGVYGLAGELTGRVRWACLAAVLWAVLLANYRTIGIILIREDFSLPWFSLHLWLLARAARVRTPVAFAGAGLALSAAAATWHAMAFVLALEAGCALLWFLRTGRNPLAVAFAWLVPAVPALASFAIPALAAKRFVLSPAMAIAWALLAGAAAARLRPISRWTETGVVLGVLALALAIPRVLGGSSADYAHVFELLVAKVRFLGVLPDDPAQLSFGARLLWDGPFETASPVVLIAGLSTGLAALLAGVALYGRDWWRGQGDPRECLLVALGAAALASTLLIERVYVLVGILAPVIAVVLLCRVEPQRRGMAAMAGLIAVAAGLQAMAFTGWKNDWYPPGRVADRAHLVRWVAENVHPAAPIASDFVNATAFLAHSRQMVMQQPKYETARSRDRIQDFFETFFQSPLGALRQSLRDEGARYLVVDRYLLAENTYIAGMPRGASPRAGTAAAHMLSRRPRVFENVPGFELVYRSPPEVGLDSYRVYRIR